MQLRGNDLLICLQLRHNFITRCRSHASILLAHLNPTEALTCLHIARERTARCAHLAPFGMPRDARSVPAAAWARFRGAGRRHDAGCALPARGKSVLAIGMRPVANTNSGATERYGSIATPGGVAITAASAQPAASLNAPYSLKFNPPIQLSTYADAQMPRHHAHSQEPRSTHSDTAAQYFRQQSRRILQHRDRGRQNCGSDLVLSSDFAASNYLFLRASRI
jgi:hypothetical protein